MDFRHIDVITAKRKQKKRIPSFCLYKILSFCFFCLLVLVFIFCVFLFKHFQATIPQKSTKIKYKHLILSGHVTKNNGIQKPHCVKSARIRSFSGPHFSVLGLNTEKKNSEHGHFSRSALEVKNITFEGEDLALYKHTTCISR